ncbi:MAG: zinc-dependent alcohol dehydrogenase [Candidatus Binatia bacterium]
MRQLSFIAPGTVRWEEVAEPRLETPEAALVRPLVVTTCDLDHAIVQGHAPLAGPFPLGHEFVAEVVDTGQGVTSFRPGQRVVVPFQVSCGRCDRCTSGLTGSCRTARPGAAYGMKPIGGDWGGALADLVRVPFADAMLVELADGISPTAVASASDNLPDAWRTVAPHLADRPGADVLVVGGWARSIALYAVAIARALGAGRVDYVDADRERLERAEKLGARPLEGPPPRRAGSFPITVDASGDPAGLACALRSVEPNGVCTSVAIYFAETPLPLLEMYTRGVHFITARVNARPHIPEVLELVGAGRLHPEVVNSAIVPWDDADEAIVADLLKPVFVRPELYASV